MKIKSFCIIISLIFFSKLSFASLKRKQNFGEDTLEEEINVKEARVNGSRNLFERLDENCLYYLIGFSPRAQAKLLSTGVATKKFIDALRPTQTEISLNLKLPGFSHLPLHRDLLVFEGVTFPRSLEGKVHALTFVFRMIETVLFRSSLYEPILRIVLDEAVFLAREHPEHFQQFLALSGFETNGQMRKILEHFIVKTENIDGLLTLKLACPNLFTLFNLFLDSFSYEEIYIDMITDLGKYFCSKPENFIPLCGQKTSFSTVLSLIGSEMPIETVTTILIPFLGYINISLMFLPILSSKFVERLPNTKLFCDRFVILVSNIAKSESYSQEILNEFNSWIALIYARFGYDNLHDQMFDSEKFDQEVLRQHLSYVYLLNNKFEEALEFLPDDYAPHLYDLIPRYSQFCKLLAERNSEWIRKYYNDVTLNYHQLIISSHDLFLAFYNVDSFAKIYNTLSFDKILKLLPHIFAFRPIDEIRAFLKPMSQVQLSKIYKRYLKSNTEVVKFIQIVKLFVELGSGTDHPTTYSYSHVFKNPEFFLAILETGDLELIEKLSSPLFLVKFTIQSKLFLEIINSDKLRPRLLALKPLIDSFPQFSAKRLKCRSPIEVAYGCQFNNRSFESFIKELIETTSLDFFHKKLIKVDFVMIIIALSQAWFEYDFRPQDEMTEFKSPISPFIFSDISEPESIFLQSLYALLSERTKMIVNKGFRYAALINRQLLDAENDEEEEDDSDIDENDDDAEISDLDEDDVDEEQGSDEENAEDD